MLTRTILSALLLTATTLVGTVLADTECGPPACEPIACTLEPCPAPCESIGCDPCAPACGSSVFKLFRGGSRIKVNGWIEAGIIGNSHGADYNGGAFLYAPQTTKFNVNQIWLSAEREMDASKGFDWGAKLDYMFGMEGPGVQSYGDESFDYNWNTSDDYGSGFHQLFFTLGYKDFSIKVGKFGTPIGWEETRSWDNFFYSHSNAFYIEPCTHTGFLASYAVNDWLTVFAGWTAGMENFANRYNDNAFLGGFEAKLSENGMLYYYLTNGREHEGRLRDGSLRHGGLGDSDYFIQSICYEWNITDRWTYLFQYDLHNANYHGVRWSAYAINNLLFYKINDKWAAGLRFEWMRDNGGDAGWLGPVASDYYEYTLGVNWNPTDHLRIRPEIRYDRAAEAKPFGNNRSDQFSGGFAVLWGF